MKGPIAMRRLLLSAVAAAPLLLALAPATALGSCAMAPNLEESVRTADMVFVGTVTETSNRNSWAGVQVEEVWRGPDQERSVVVKGGPGGNAATSVDRAFEAGVKYLFFPYVDPALGLADNSCTSTQPWTEAMLELRPAEVRAPLGVEPEPTGFDVGGLLAPIGVAVIVGGVLLLAGLAARGRRAD